MKESLDKVFHWIIDSSADPAEVSLTVKGALLGTIPAILAITGFAHINLGSDTLTAIFDDLALIVQYGLGLVAAVSVTIGAIRKVWNTIQSYPR